MKPEEKIRAAIIDYVEARGWHAEIMHGNAFQVGIPDLYLYHRKWGARWVDAKVPGKYTFTKAQKIKWPKWERAGIGIWILVAGTQEEYDKLFGPPNWRNYWKASWGVLPDIDALLEGLRNEASDTTE